MEWYKSISIYWFNTPKPHKEKYVARFLPMAKARNLNAYLMTSYIPHPRKKTRCNYLQCVGIKYFTSVIFTMLFSK
jgi:hypothetical protein